MGLLAAFVGDEGDERRAVRVILERSTVAVTSQVRRLKSTIRISLLVTAGDTARRDMALVVTATRLALAFGQP